MCGLPPVTVELLALDCPNCAALPRGRVRANSHNLSRKSSCGQPRLGFMGRGAEKTHAMTWCDLACYRERHRSVRIDRIGISYNFGLPVRHERFLVEQTDVSACQEQSKCLFEATAARCNRRLQIPGHDSHANLPSRRNPRRGDIQSLQVDAFDLADLLRWRGISKLSEN